MTSHNAYEDRLAVRSYIVTPENAIGKCDLAILGALCDDHEFTVFARSVRKPPA